MLLPGKRPSSIRTPQNPLDTRCRQPAHMGSPPASSLVLRPVFFASPLAGLTPRSPLGSGPAPGGRQFSTQCIISASPSCHRCLQAFGFPGACRVLSCLCFPARPSSACFLPHQASQRCLAEGLSSVRGQRGPYLSEVCSQPWQVSHRPTSATASLLSLGRRCDRGMTAPRCPPQQGPASSLSAAHLLPLPPSWMVPFSGLSEPPPCWAHSHPAQTFRVWVLSYSPKGFI